MLHHYTCVHSAQGIIADGRLRTMADHHGMRELAPGLDWMLHIIWLTDLDMPHPRALGLDRRALHCDRTTWRFTAADTTTVVPWTRWVRSRTDITRRVRAEVEAGCLPAHWWISCVPVPVRLPALRTHRSGALLGRTTADG